MSSAIATKEPVHVVNYDITDAYIEETRAKYAALDATTPSGYETVRQAIAVVRGTRGAVERRRVELKADALEYGRKVDAEAKRITALLSSIEDPLVEKKEAIDDAKAKAKAEAEAARLKEVEAKIAAERAEEEARLKAIRDAEDARLAEERARLAVEREALDEQRRQDERARADAQAAEDARQKAQRERERAERDAEDARLRVEREAIEKERRELAAAKELADRAEFERRAKAKAEADAAAKVEADRLAAAEREAKIAALLPDAKKLEAFAATIAALEPPTVKTKQAKQAIDVAVRQLAMVAEGLRGLEKKVA